MTYEFQYDKLTLQDRNTITLTNFCNITKKTKYLFSQ